MSDFETVAYVVIAVTILFGLHFYLTSGDVDNGSTRELASRLNKIRDRRWQSSSCKQNAVRQYTNLYRKFGDNPDATPQGVSVYSLEIGDHYYGGSALGHSGVIGLFIAGSVYYDNVAYDDIWDYYSPNKRDRDLHLYNELNYQLGF